MKQISKIKAFKMLFLAFVLLAAETKNTQIGIGITNLATSAFNVYFDTSSPFGNAPHSIDDVRFEIIK